MKPLPEKENNRYNEQEICHICKEKFCVDKDDKDYSNRKKVKDPCHITGKFRGPAHSTCNLNYKDQKEIPVIIHNATYDTHFIINQLAIEFKGELNRIGDNMEKYITFSVPIKKEAINNNDDKKISTCKLKFIDRSCIERLKINSECYYVGLKADKLIHKCEKCKKKSKKQLDELKETFPSISQFCNRDLNEFVLLLRKGVYPYEYIDSWEKFNETALPPKKDFYRNLYSEDISDKDYKHAQKVWDVFQIKYLGEYHDLYVQSDTLLLSDIFENFRNMCLKIYEFVSVFFAFALGLAWKICLKKTEVKLEVIKNYNMILMIEKGIKGGICQATHRYAKANNKYM